MFESIKARSVKILSGSFRLTKLIFCHHNPNSQIYIRNGFLFKLWDKKNSVSLDKKAIQRWLAEVCRDILPRNFYFNYWQQVSTFVYGCKSITLHLFSNVAYRYRKKNKVKSPAAGFRNQGVRTYVGPIRFFLGTLTNCLGHWIIFSRNIMMSIMKSAWYYYDNIVR